MFECDRKAWGLFSRHHYLSNRLSSNARCFVGMIDDRPAAFVSTSRFPHATVKNMMMLSRIVVIPDFQGIGVAGKMIDSVSDHLFYQGWRVRITTSHPGMIGSLKGSQSWICKRQGRNGRHRGTVSEKGSSGRITTSWEYKQI